MPVTPAPPRLPIDATLPELIRVLARHNQAVLQAPPGAGKTTRAPLAIREEKWLAGRKIIMLEPRRIAARGAARQMARLLGEKVGQTVGYRMRLDTQIGPQTRIEVVTEGILSRMLQHDPALEDVGLVIFDEFHERSLQSDLGLALCLDSQSALRDDLRILIMSATLDGAAVTQLLDDAPLIHSAGRSFPVSTHYRPVHVRFEKNRRGFCQAVATMVRQVMEEEHGSALVFLPGMGEIRNVAQQLAGRLDDATIICPLYGQLSGDEQDAAIQPAADGQRKVVLATAIAETSLTIEGVRIVIDSGLMRGPRFDPNTGLTRLFTQNVSRAAADQRRGRAGRLEAGVCYHLWTESQRMPAHSPAEILQADLAPLVLEISQWGVTDPLQLRWLDPPPQAALDQATELLRALGAVDESTRLTAHGQAMMQLAAHPRLAHMMLKGRDLGWADLACELAALLGERDILRGPAAFETDIGLRIASLRDHRKGAQKSGVIERIRQTARHWQHQLSGAQNRPSTDPSHSGALLAYAYPDRIGQRRASASASTRYLLSNGRGAFCAEDDPLRSHAYIVAAHVDGQREARIFLAATLAQEDLLEHHGHLLETRQQVDWNSRAQSVEASRREQLGALTITRHEWRDAPNLEIEQALLAGIRDLGLGCLPWDAAATELRQRLQFLHNWSIKRSTGTPPMDQQWPDYGDHALLEQLSQWLLPYLNQMKRISHLSRLNLREILAARLDWKQQQAVERLAPSHIKVPSGSRVRLDYSQSPPVLAVRLQEVFGLGETPRIAGGEVSVLMHLLSPARRPVQITQDLAAFWSGGYQQVKKELKGRYPKHYWPEDPHQATATARVRPR